MSWLLMKARSKACSLTRTTLPPLQSALHLPFCFSSNSKDENTKKTTGLGFVPAVGHGHFRQRIAYRHRLLSVDFAGLYSLSQNGFITVGVAGLLALVLSMIPSRAIAEFLLSLNGNQFLERFSSRVYLFPVRLGQRQLRVLPSGDLQLLLEQSAPAADRLRS